MKKRILALVLCLAMCMSTVALFSSCGGSNTGDGEKPDAFVIMSEDFDGVFNPFFSTTAADGTIVSMTQIGMLSSEYVKGVVDVAYGEDHATVTKDFEISDYDKKNDETVYTFVLKNGIKYSDGEPLTMEDVLFNLYVYLDPSYTGSSTIYSTKIKGLTEYRTQSNATSGTSQDELITEQATQRAQARINELINLFMSIGKEQSGYNATYDEMIEAIEKKKKLSEGYVSAVAGGGTNETLIEDYEYALKLFKEELNDDYVAAQSAYTESEPYKSNDFFKDEIARFMYHEEGFVTIKWGKKVVNGKETDDKSVIESVTANYNKDVVATKEDAIDYVYNTKIETELHIILSAWATAAELLTEYTAEAKGVILDENKSTDGTLKYDHISGIVSLGHNTDETSINVNGTTYKIAQEHNEDGTPKNDDEYDVLQITIEGQDPKAKWNFAFSVAPQHYYGDSKYPVDIESNQFGVAFGEYEFMKNIIQNPNKTAVPVGAGAYKATNVKNEDNPSGTGFLANNVVYFKANDKFETVGENIENAKIEKVRYQALPAADAITLLESGNVHYISPQLTNENYDKLVNLRDNKGGFDFIQEKQLGYGYIGINASIIQDLELRQAIMCAMNTSTSLNYYRPGTAEQIYWPMSTVSWAYPTNEDGSFDNANGKDYPYIGNWSKDANGDGMADGEAAARNKIQSLMDDAGVKAGDDKLKIEFTIAGASTDHPTFQTFIDAAALLNSMGWDITVVPDATALTKLSSGGLTVWAAAWGSTLDPDMYQVYHKNSTASSTRAWGYSYLRTEGGEQEAILDDLSEKIDEAREILDEKERAAIYKEAMSLLLDLAVELPVYQRSVVYAYNSDVIDSESFPDVSNPYSSPLDRIWELEFKD
ncbi:MAG: hypothetical protein IJ437_00955 [Clostridia bacterium]|nr:hypothetical protein [Clostridia bacterium]